MHTKCRTYFVSQMSFSENLKMSTGISSSKLYTEVMIAQHKTTWAIEKIPVLVKLKKKKNLIRSPSFEVQVMSDDGLTTTEWYLKVSPAGYGSNNHGFLSVYLFRGGAAETSSSLKTEVELSVGQLKKVFVRKFSPGNGYGFHRYVSHGDLGGQLIGAGTIVIRCEVTIHPRKSCRGYILPPQASLKGSGPERKILPAC
jgi:hypothetical protein